MVSMQNWSAAAVTAANPLQAQAYQKELFRLQQKGVIPDTTILLAVPDPSSERVGSGGATLNALLTVSEYLSARAGLSYIDPEILQDSKILIIHSGGIASGFLRARFRAKLFLIFRWKWRMGNWRRLFCCFLIN